MELVDIRDKDRLGLFLRCRIREGVWGWNYYDYDGEGVSKFGIGFMMVFLFYTTI